MALKPIKNKINFKKYERYYQKAYKIAEKTLKRHYDLTNDSNLSNKFLIYNYYNKEFNDVLEKSIFIIFK